MQPETRYAVSTGGVNIAYQVMGDASRDLVMVPGWVFNLEVVWEHPSFEAFIKRLIRNFRVIMFDKRGTGLSDRDAARSTMEERMDDVRAVMDAVGSNSASVMGWSEGANIAGLFAATYPERVERLVLYAGGARYKLAPDYPIGMSDEYIEFGRDVLRNHWGEGLAAYLIAPSLARDESFRRWFGRFERLSVSPGQGEAMLNLNLDIDTTEVLKTIKVPTLVLHNSDDSFVPVEFSRYVAQHVPGAELVILDGDSHLFWFGNPDDVLDELERFFLGAPVDDLPERVLSTVVFTDIVGSTRRASEVGDARWRELLDAHDRLARESVARFRGEVVKMTGDGLLATFDGPARAVTCATRFQREVERVGLESRAAVHTGEIVVRDGDVGGIGVHIASRLLKLARPGEVLASRTVKDLSVGGDIQFHDRGVHSLEGLSEPWRLYAATA